MNEMPASPSRLERLRGLLLGGALGDALGAPVEFMSRREILARFGPRGITDFAPAYGREGAITDDTQMTLFTLEGLIRADVRYRLKGVCNPVGVIGHAYRRWRATQEDRAVADPELDGWLIQQAALWSRRAPGLTCMSALTRQGSFAEPARNDSKGAGGIMRVGPIGLVEARDPFELARAAAALSHGHVTGQVAAGWFAAWIDQIAKGHSLQRSAMNAWQLCRGQAPELDRALEQALQLADGGYRPALPDDLGEGWIAEEAAAIALWCVLVAPDPMEAVRLAANIDGDSDTTGTLVGQVFGALLGAAWIPPSMLERLELVDVMEALAQDAEALFSGAVEPEALWARYPGW